MDLQKEYFFVNHCISMFYNFKQRNVFTYLSIIFLCLSVSDFTLAQSKADSIAQENFRIKKRTFATLPKGQFLQDSLKIGLPIIYSLSIKHLSEIQILFPDTNYNFRPFELIRKTYFPTKTDSTGSLDSVIYELTTFEIDKVQKLSLPIFVAEGDCTVAIYAKPDSIYLQELVKGSLEKAQLKEFIEYQPLQEHFNYPYLITGILVLLIFVLIIWGLLGKQILKAYQMFQFRTRHAIFLKEFARLANRITSRQSIEDIERAIGLWKKHLEYVENEPFSTYTSKEISQLVPNQALGDSLKKIDKAIYGKEVSNEIIDSLSTLRSFSILRFEKKREELRNA